jgi:hypothetical protein
MQALAVRTRTLAGAALLAAVASCSAAPDRSPPAGAGGEDGNEGGSGGSGGAGAGGSGGRPAPTAGAGGGFAGSGGSGGAADPGQGGRDAGAGTGPDAGGPAADATSPDPTELGEPITDGLTQLLVSRGIGLGYYHACHILDTQRVKCYGTSDPRNRPPADVVAAGGKLTQIACAHNGCCTLMPPGSSKVLSCWSHKATFYPPATGIVEPIQFGIGYDHGCALNKDHSVKCWGTGRGPQNSAPEGMKAKMLAVATFFNCAVLMDDSVTCWGAIAPKPPEGLKAKLIAAINHDNTRADQDDITKSTGHVCAIKMDDTLVCWGDNIEGTTDVPPDLGKVRDVAAATWNTCAVKLDGEVRCWGTKRYNNSPDRYHPQPQGIRLKSIRSKLATYCGLKMDNTMACWGDESNVHITIEPPTQKFYTTP